MGKCKIIIQKKKIELITLVELELYIGSFNPEQTSYVPPRFMRILLQDHILRFTKDQLNALTEEQIAALRQNQCLQTIDQVLNLYRVNPALIRLFSNEELEWIENQIQAQRTENQIQALSYYMQALDVSHTSPRESPRAGSWTEVVAEVTKIIEQGLGKS